MIGTCEYYLIQDGILIENMHDIPWKSSSSIGPDTVSAMSVVCAAVRREVPHLPIGVQVLCGGNREALAIAKSTGKRRFLPFITKHMQRVLAS